MKTVLLHGLGQTAHDWDAVIHCATLQDIDCPELPALAKEELTYSCEDPVRRKRQSKSESREAA